MSWNNVVAASIYVHTRQKYFYAVVLIFYLNVISFDFD